MAHRTLAPVAFRGFAGALVIFALFGFNAQIFASTLYWDPNGASGTGGSGTWDTVTPDWAQGSDTGPLVTYDNGVNDSVVLDGAAGTITIAANDNINVNLLTFETGGYTITVPLTVGGATPTTLTLSGANPAITTGTLSETITGNLAGTSGFTLNGGAGGNLTLATTTGTSSATTTGGSATVTLPSTTGLFVGMPVSGSGISAGTTISSINSAAGTITLSATATATGSPTLTFTSVDTWTGNAVLNGGATLTVNSIQSPTAGFVLNNGATLAGNQALNNTNFIYANSGASTVTVEGGANLYALFYGNGNINWGEPGLSNVSNGLNGASTFANFGGTVFFGANGTQIRSTNNSGQDFSNPFANFDMGTSTGNIASKEGSDLILLGGVQGTGTNTAVGNWTSTGGHTLAVQVGSANLTQAYAGMLADNTGDELIKVGTGTLTLTGSDLAENTYVGYETDGYSNAILGGTLLLNYSAHPSNLMQATGTLEFGQGGTLSLLGNSGAAQATTQTVASTTVNSGGGAIIVNANGGQSTTFNLGALTTTAAGATLNIQETSPNAVVTTTTALNPDGTYGGAVTFTDANGNTNFATSTGASPYVISGYTGYTPYATGSVSGSGTDYLINDSQTVAAGATMTLLKVTNDTAGQTVALSGTLNLLGTGGDAILFTGSNAETISGGTIISGNGAGGPIVLYAYGPGALTMGATIAGTTLTIAGNGMIILPGSLTNTYTGVTYIESGATLSASANAGFGAAGTGAAINLDGGALQATSSFGLFNGAAGTNNRNIVIGGGGGTFDVTSGNVLTVAGIVSNTAVDGAQQTFGPLIKTDSGTLVLSNTANTYEGATIINGGILSVSALANGNAASNIGESPAAADALVINGGTLQYTGAGSTTNRTFTLGATGGALDASGAGAVTYSSTGPVWYTSSGSRTLTLTGSSIAANTLDAAITDPSYVSSTYTGSTSVNKTGSGEWVLGGANTYSGGTTISGGTLQVGTGDTSALGTGTVTLTSGGTLDLNSVNLAVGSLSGTAGTITSTTGSAVLAVGNSSASTYTFGGAIQNGASGTVGLTTQGAGTTLLTGANTYTGATNVGGGSTLAIGAGGSLSDTAITVAGGGTFHPEPVSGNITIGTTAASLNLTAGSIFSMVDGGIGTVTLNAPGAGTGTVLTLGGTTGTPATLDFELGSTGADELIANNGTVSFASSPDDLISLTRLGTTAPTTLTNIPLLSVPDGTLSLSDFNLQSSTVIFGQTGYVESLSLNGADNELLLNLTAVPLNYYWTGKTSTSWSALGNFATTAAGTTAQTVPIGSPSNIFLTANSTQAGNVATETLDGNYTINSLSFTGTGTAAATTPIAVNGTGDTLTIDAQNLFVDSNGNNYGPGVGIVVQAGSAAGHSINANINLGSSQTWEINNTSSNSLTVSGVIADAPGTSLDSLTKTGPGTLILSNANTYDGGTTIAAGTLMLGAGGSLSTTGTVTVEGTFDLAGNSQSVTGLSDGGVSTGNVTSSTGASTLTITNASPNVYSGAITDSYNTTGSSLGLVLAGASNVTLSGSSNFSGGVTLEGGNLTVAGNYALGSPTTTNPNGGLTLSPLSGTVNAYFTSANPVLASLNGGGGNVILGGTNGTPTTLNVGAGGAAAYGSGSMFSGVISDMSAINPNAVGNLNVYGGGFLELLSANTFTGVTTISGSNAATGYASELMLQSPLALEYSTLNYNNQGGAINFGSLGAVTLGGLTGSEALTLANNNGTAITLTFDGNHSTVYTGNLNGAGALDMATAGAIQLGSGNTGGASYTGNTTISEGTLILGGTSYLTGTVDMTGYIGTTSELNGLTVQDHAVINSSSALNLVSNDGGNGNNYPGASTLVVTGTGSVIVPTLNIGTGSRVPNGTSVTVSQSGLLEVTGTFDVEHSEGSTASNSAVNLNGGTLAAGAIIYGGGDINTGNGAGAPNQFATINFNGGTLEALSSDPAGSSFIPNSQSTDVSYPTYYGITTNIQAGGAIVNTNGFNVTIANPLLHDSTGAIDGGLTVIGAGSLTLTATNTYTGATTINPGSTLQLGKGTIGNDGTIVTSSGITDSGSLVFDRYGALSSPVAISGTGTVMVEGPGSQTLGGLNTYTGATTVASGSLIVSGSLAGTTAMTVASGATLEVDGYLNNSTAAMVSGRLTGAGDVGAVNIAAGATLAPGFDSATPATAGVMTANGAVTLANSTSDFSIRLGVASATDNDQLDVASGDKVTLNGANFQLTLGSAFNATSLPSNFIWVLINGGTSSPGNITGEFAQGTLYTDSNGDTYNILYNVNSTGMANGGSDVDLELVAAVPEPGAWASTLAGLAVLVVWHRSRRRRIS